MCVPLLCVCWGAVCDAADKNVFAAYQVSAGTSRGNFLGKLDLIKQSMQNFIYLETYKGRIIMLKN